MGQTLANFQAALKRDYHGPIIDSLRNLSPTYRLIEKNEEDVSGDTLTAYVPIKTRRNQGIASIAENAALPPAQNSAFLQLAIPLTNTYGRIEFTGQTMAASRKSSTAFAKVVDVEVNGMVEAMKINVNRMLCNGNGTGYLGQTNGTGGGADATVTVNNPGTQYLEEGQSIYSLDAETAGTATGDVDISEGLTAATAYRVGPITSDTTFELYDSAFASIATEKWSDNRFLFRYGSQDNEMMGLRGVIDNEAIKATSSWFGFGNAITTIYGSSRVTNPILDANIVHNNNATQVLTEANMENTLDTIEKASGQLGAIGKRCIITSYGVKRAYVDLLQADRRYVKPLNLVGGWKAIAYQYGNEEIPIIVDKQAVPNTMMFVNTKFLAIYRASEFDWLDYDGSMFQRKIDSNGEYDAYTATMYCYMNLGCSNFKAQGALRDITEA